MKRELLITIITIFLLLALIMPKASRPRQVWATYNNTKIILNGIQISNQNAEPVTINGIVYLPVRTIPERPCKCRLNGKQTPIQYILTLKPRNPNRII